MKKIVCCIVLLFVFLGFSKSVLADDHSRYISIVIDNSKSMEGVPFEKEKEATLSMLDNLSESKDKTYISLIALNGSSRLISDFTENISLIKGKVNDLTIENGTNYSSSLSIVERIFDKVLSSENSSYNLFFCSDGIPLLGDSEYDGVFNFSDSFFSYAYGNKAVELSDILKNKGIDIYTLGFFHSLTNEEKNFGEKLLSLMATNNNYHIVDDVNKLYFKFEEVANDILDDSSDKDFQYAMTNKDDKNGKLKYRFLSDYFGSSSYYYNAKLSKMSLSLAMSAFATHNVGYDEKLKNLKELFNSMNFDSYDFMETYTQKPTIDSIAAGVANKKFKINNEDVTLVVIAIRGAGYEAEWTSNLTVGDKNNHNGFEKAKNDVREYLEEYLRRHQINGKVKFWITGFSRAAATSNLLAASIIDNPVLSLNYSSEDVYAYTFETPAGTVDKNYFADQYSGIFNIINRNDLVPRVAPENWGFYRYGKNLYLPTNVSTSEKVFGSYKNQMIGILSTLNDHSLKYLIDDFRFQGNRIDKMDMVTFMDDFIMLLSENVISSRDSYYQNLQEDIRYVISTFYSVSDKKLSVFIDEFLTELKVYLDRNKLKISLLNQSFDDIADIFVKVYCKHIDSDFSKERLVRLAKKIVYIAGSISLQRFDDMVTLLMNLETIKFAHYPELCYAWMSVMPDYDDRVFFNNDGYRYIHINCPVDVHVYDESHTLVASIENEQPKEISSLVAGIDADGQKYVILPNTDDYTIEIKAREDTKTNYGVDEYSALAGEYTRFVNYFDVDMKKDEVITASVPKQSQEELDSSIPDGSNQVYTLSQNGNNLQATSDLKGDAAKNAYYDIEVVSEDENKGMTSGNVFKAYGQFVEIQAEAKEGYQFMGWFVDNQKVSDQTTYRIRIEKPLKYVAKFENKKDSTTSSSSQSSKTTGSTNDTTQSSNLIEKQANQKVNKKKSTFMNAGMKFMPYVAIGLGLIGVSVFLIHFNRKKK